jgi:AcrR family transcriptional regulator
MAVLQEKNTKDRILDAGFSFYTAPCFTNVSLSGIASRAGITKAAIFRHFKSKEKLFDSMSSRYFDDIRSLFPESAVPFPVLLERLVGLLHQHEEYLFYTLYQYISDTSFEARVFVELQNRGVDLLSYGICSGVSEDKTRIRIRDKGEYYRLLYEVATTVFFMISRSFRFCNTTEMSDTEFVSSLNKLFERGISSSGYILSEERKKEIDRWCRITPEDVRQPDPFFDALSEVIRKKGFPGTTVESIASELGLAKSSLYTYFKNKDELIVTLVEKELLFLAGVVKRKTDKGGTYEERGYIMMRSMIEYYRMCPSVVSVAAWLRMRGSFMFDSIRDKIGIDVSEFTKPEETAAGFPMTQQLFYGWLHMLVTTVFCQSRINGLSFDNCTGAVSTYYRYIQQGAYNDEKI